MSFNVSLQQCIIYDESFLHLNWTLMIWLSQVCDGVEQWTHLSQTINAKYEILKVYKESKINIIHSWCSLQLLLTYFHEWLLKSLSGEAEHSSIEVNVEIKMVSLNAQCIIRIFFFTQERQGTSTNILSIQQERHVLASQSYLYIFQAEPWVQWTPHPGAYILGQNIQTYAICS